VLARRILRLTPLGTLSTRFPTSSDASTIGKPDGLDGLSIGLMDYIADCEENGNPTILAVKIGTTFRNVDAGSNISLAVAWTPPHPPKSRLKFPSWFSSSKSKGALPFSAANQPRFSLLGHLDTIEQDVVEDKDIAKCYTDMHVDAKYWLPGGGVHRSEWARLIVDQIYWVGGFGDRAYIGWLNVEDYNQVTEEEIENVRLPGEKKGWSE
jgi:hypothetical protein